MGVYLRPLGNVIVWMPPLAISSDELDLLISATREAINEFAREL
jgi:adenosylmethionine-8-amino-7-oxononanoate aminotransferase